MLLEHDFALAILDVQMPEMDGFELAQLMRGTDKTRHIPIVFVTAAGKEMNFSFQGYESGAVDFLHKPLDINAVQSKVNVFVALHQQRAETRRQVQALEHSRQQQEALLQELRATQAELQRSLRMRDEFMSMVAHELRTPLNTLFLETQMRTLNLERGNLAAFAPEKLPKMVARDARQIRSMVRLIDDMLDVSRISSGKLSIRREPVDLAALVRRVAEDLAPGPDQMRVQVQEEAQIEGYWDGFRVEQIVVNLISNALRYGEGKPVDISLAKTSNSAVIEVRDHGIGIGAKDQERIFDAFERVMQPGPHGRPGSGAVHHQAAGRRPRRRHHPAKPARPWRAVQRDLAAGGIVIMATIPAPAPARLRISCCGWTAPCASWKTPARSCPSRRNCWASNCKPSKWPVSISASSCTTPPCSHAWSDGLAPGAAGEYFLGEYAAGLAAELEADHPVAVDDVRLDPRTAAPGALATFGRLGIRAFLNIPIVKEGQLAALFVVHSRAARAWQADEIDAGGASGRTRLGQLAARPGASPAALR